MTNEFFTNTVCFAGAGLMDKAIKAAGGKIIQAIEFDSEIAKIYKANFPEVNLIESAIETVDPIKLEPTDHVSGSPPCQRASQANNKGESSEDVSAAQAFLGIVATMLNRTCGKQPKWVTMENVRGYAKFRSFGIIEGGLRALGYQVGFQVLNAADFGVPQSRERLILRAALPGHSDAFTQLSLFDRGELLPIVPPKQKHVGWFEAIGHLIPELPQTTLANWQIQQLKALGSTHAVTLLNACDTSIWSKPIEPTNPAFTQRCWNRPESNAPKILLLDSKNSRNQGNGATRKTQSEPSFTLTNYPCNAHTPKVLSFAEGLLQTIDLDTSDIKLLTPECGEILQMYGCQTRIIFPKNTNNIYKWKAIGNGVPYLLGLAVMRSLVAR